MTTATKTAPALNDADSIDTIVPSNNARKALKAAGVATVGEARKRGLSALGMISGVGQVSLERLIAAFGEPERTTPKDQSPDTWEESTEPVHLHSPSGGFRFPLKKARMVFNPQTGTSEEQLPLWVEFDGGEAVITRRHWFLKAFDGDEVKADAAEQANQPWRQAAVRWLQSRRSYRQRMFFIKTD